MNEFLVWKKVNVQKKEGITILFHLNYSLNPFE